MNRQQGRRYILPFSAKAHETCQQRPTLKSLYPIKRGEKRAEIRKPIPRDSPSVLNEDFEGRRQVPEGEINIRVDYKGNKGCAIVRKSTHSFHYGLTVVNVKRKIKAKQKKWGELSPLRYNTSASDCRTTYQSNVQEKASLFPKTNTKIL